MKTRKAAIPALVATMFLALSAPQTAGAEQLAKSDIGAAKGFVADLAEEAIGIMDVAGPSTEAGDRKLRELLAEGMSFEIMGRRTVGEAWQNISAQERDEFTELFRTYLLNYFINLLDESDPDDFSIQNAKQIGTSDVLVHSTAYRSGIPLAEVDWVVRRMNGEYRVVDIVLSDVSLVRTYGSEFGSVINIRGMDALLVALRNKVEAH